VKLHRTIGLAAALVLAVGLVAGCGGESAPEGEAQAAAEGCVGSAATCEKAATCGEAAAAMCGEAEAAMCAGGMESVGDANVSTDDAGACVCAAAKEAGEEVTCPGDASICERHAALAAQDGRAPCGTAKKDAEAGCGGCPRAKAAAKATADMDTDQPG